MRCLTRPPEVLAAGTAPSTTVVVGDALVFDSLAAALDGVELAYYLLHSMAAGDRFEAIEGAPFSASPPRLAPPESARSSTSARSAPSPTCRGTSPAG